MKLIVKTVGAPWKFDDKADPLWTLTAEGQTEPIRTYDADLAKVGEFDAESYTAKSGKVYWRTIKERPQRSFGAKEFKADPLKQDSIEWQACLKAAVETVKDFYLMADSKPATLDGYAQEVLSVLVTYKNTVNEKPTEIPEPEEVVRDAGDFAKINPDEPPVENYDDLISEEVSLDDIPFC